MNYQIWKIWVFENKKMNDNNKYEPLQKSPPDSPDSFYRGSRKGIRGKLISYEPDQH